MADSMREKVMRMLFPPRCIFCGSVMQAEGACPDCGDILQALRLTGDDRLLVAKQQKTTGHLDRVLASFLYTKAAAECVAKYKFENQREMARGMTVFMAEDIRDLTDLEEIDFVVDVPSFKDRRDHARILAKQVASKLKLPYRSEILVKSRKTDKQHDLRQAYRESNIKDAFSVAPGADVAGKTILICDDVMTTGNTLDMCAKALKEAGAARVIGAAFSATKAG